jgi:subtilisin family serine protease
VAFPASLEHAIAVGAHDAAKIPANFSNIGAALDIVAPGVTINSSWKDGNYRSASGSSMASPMVAGVTALIIELERNLGS